MKKIAYILGIICAMTMQSCLDLEPKTQLADTNYWKSPEHFKLFATQFYGWSADFRWLDDSQHADIRSDLFAGSTVNIYSNGTNSIPSSDKHYTDNYNRIRQTNTLLQQADTYEQQADIAISVGEARFFRAYCYFELLQAYGDLIITRTPLDIDSPTARFPNSSRRNSRFRTLSSGSSTSSSSATIRISSFWKRDMPWTRFAATWPS